MKDTDRSALGRKLASLRKKKVVGTSEFFKRVRRAQERERKKLGIRFEADSSGGWLVFAGNPEKHVGGVKQYRTGWANSNFWDSPSHPTRLEAAKELISAPPTPTPPAFDTRQPDIKRGQGGRSGILSCR